MNGTLRRAIALRKDCLLPSETSHELSRWSFGRRFSSLTGSRSGTDETVSFVVECPDQHGIIASVTNLLSSRGANITSVDQYLAPAAEPELRKPEETAFQDVWRKQHPTWYQNNFLMRFECSVNTDRWSREQIEKDALKLAGDISGNVRAHFSSKPLSMAIMLSKSEHCAAELLYRWRLGELPCRISCIISNHSFGEKLAVEHGIPFHFFPVASGNKWESEILEKVSEDTDLLVLARYMQVLSPQFLAQYRKPIINIHHGLLPAFKGARPYEQMYRAGVKIIGATAHYVTPQLDEGPIIHQEVAPVNHRMTTSQLKETGVDLERRALASAAKKHLENKLVRFGDRVIVF